MRYLRDREMPEAQEAMPEAQERSSNPPLVMTVRNPNPNDGVEINRHISDNSRIAQDELQPFVFASGMRRDLLGDPDWFASAVVRYMQTILEGNTTLESVRERLTAGQLQNIVRSILSGLGYEVDLHHEQGQEDHWTEIRAWSPGGSGEIPDIQAEAAIYQDPIMARSGDVTPVGERSRIPAFYPIHGEVLPGTERLLVFLTFSQGNAEESPDNALPQNLRSSSDGITWRAVSSESLGLGRERETISAQEFLENYHANITVYRVEKEGG